MSAANARTGTGVNAATVLRCWFHTMLVTVDSGKIVGDALAGTRLKSAAAGVVALMCARIFS